MRGATVAAAARFAGRSLRGTFLRAFRGFGIFIACLALGVAAIAGVAGLGRSFDAAIAAQGDVILGGDLSFSLLHRRATAAEAAFLAARGETSEIATLRAMAHGPSGSALVELKAVDAAYPLVGRLTDATGADGRVRLTSETTAAGTVYGALAEDTLLARLKVAVGDEIGLGSARLRIDGIIGSEPDGLAGGIGFGPRLIVPVAALEASGLLAPGSLVRWHTRLRLADGTDRAATIPAVTAAAQAAFPGNGWQVRSREDAAPGLKTTIERFVQFLTLVGLTTLVIGGIGVANAVTGHLERRRETIAIWKALGATSGFVILAHAFELGALAAIGIVIGLAVGAAVPIVFAGPIGAVLGLDLVAVVSPSALVLAGLEGALTAAMFATPPLLAAVATRPAALFRDDALEAPTGIAARLRRVLPAAVPAVALVGLVLWLTPDRRIAVPYLVVLVVALVGLRLVAAGLVSVLARVPRPGVFVWRRALAAIVRPGAPTAAIVLTLGLGATLVVALTQVQSGLSTAIARTLPGQAPSFFFLDVPARDADHFRTFLTDTAMGATVEDVPMLRGRIVALKGVPVEKIRVEDRVRFLLEGDRGITFSDVPPPHSTIAEGQWWPRDHAGPPLVSFDLDTGKGLGLAIGDTVTVNVLGRTIEATVANFRRIEWDRLSINFFMVFSPDAFRGAPATRLVTVTWPGGGTAEEERALFGRVVDAFPTVTAIRVKDALAQVDDLVKRSATGISVVAAFALVAAVLVLAGALTARADGRLRDAAILVALGATRRRLVAALAAEFAVVALAGGVFAGGLGTAAAWWVLDRVMKLPFAPAPLAIVAVVVGVIGLTVVLGLVATRTALSARPAAVLRSG